MKIKENELRLGYGDLQAMFLALKLSGVVDWNWWAVLMPIIYVCVYSAIWAIHRSF